MHKNTLCLICAIFMYIVIIYMQPCLCVSMHVIVPSTTLAWHHIDKASEANRGLCWHNASPHFILLLPTVHLLSRLFIPPRLSLFFLIQSSFPCLTCPHPAALPVKHKAELQQRILPQFNGLMSQCGGAAFFAHRRQKSKQKTETVSLLSSICVNFSFNYFILAASFSLCLLFCFTWAQVICTFLFLFFIFPECKM